MKAKFRDSLRNLCVRKTTDNRTAPGFIVYFVPCVLVLGLAYFGMRHLTAPQVQTNSTNSRPATPARPAQVQTERSSQTASTLNAPPPLPSSEQNPITKSARIAQPPPTPEPQEQRLSDTSGFLDTVRLAASQKAPSQQKRSTDVPEGFADDSLGARGGRSSNGRNENASTGTPINTGQPLQVPVGNVSVESLVAYSGDPTPTPKPHNAANTPQKGDLIPLGSEFSVIFLDKIQTLDLDGMVRLQVVGDVVSPNHKIKIPNGTLLYGTAAKKNLRSRVAVQLKTLVYTSDGHEVSLSGILKDEDGQPGVVAEYYPEPPSADAIGYVAPAAQSLLETLKSTVPQIAIGNGGIVQQAVQPQPYSLRNEAIDASETVIADQLRKKQQEIEDLYKAYVEVPRGTMATVQLTKALDVDSSQQEIGFRAATPPQGAPPISLPKLASMMSPKDASAVASDAAAIIK